VSSKVLGGPVLYDYREQKCQPNHSRSTVSTWTLKIRGSPSPAINATRCRRSSMSKRVRLINLAESIAAKGFSPMNRCLVLRSNIRAGKFIVLEGNRRLLAKLGLFVRICRAAGSLWLRNVLN
jgi:hypothetical protein